MNIRDYLCLKENQNISAAWILPSGKILDCGALSHISFILKNPQKFGLTDDDTKNCITYQSIDDRGVSGITTFTDGVEDKCWDKIIKKVLAMGNLRLRKVRSNKYSFTWYIDVNEYNKRTKKILSDWAYNMGEKEKDTKVMLSVNVGKAPKNLTIKDLSGIFEFHDILEITTLYE